MARSTAVRKIGRNIAAFTLIALVALALPVTQLSATPSGFLDEFDSPSLGPDWEIVREDPTHWNLTENPGSLRIKTQFGDFCCTQPRNMFLVDPTEEWSSIETRVTISPTANFHSGGIAVWVDADRVIDIRRAYHHWIGQNVAMGQRLVGGTHVPVTEDTVYLRITKSGHEYTGSYSIDGTTFIDVATYTSPDLDTAKVGIIAANGNRFTSEIDADFDYFAIRYPNAPPVADANGPYLVAVESETTFDGSGSYDPDGDVLTETWTAAGGSIADDIYTAGDETGIFDVCLTVNDGSVDSEPACTFVVVYDPSAGFVTGGGWIESPEGAYPADPELTGKATFGFVSKYKKGATVPTGNTEFHFHAGDLNFHSDSYDWLVIAGKDKAKFKGAGTINGAGEYGFMLTATDDDSGDTFRIKIWDATTDTVVYDNKAASGDETYDGTALGGGNIKIHKR